MKYEEVIDHFGTQQAVADAIGVKQPSVAAWKESGIPEARQFQIEVLSQGKLRAERKRQEPDQELHSRRQTDPHPEAG